MSFFHGSDADGKRMVFGGRFFTTMVDCNLISLVYDKSVIVNLTLVVMTHCYLSPIKVKYITPWMKSGYLQIIRKRRSEVTTNMATSAKFAGSHATFCIWRIPSIIVADLSGNILAGLIFVLQNCGRNSFVCFPQQAFGRCQYPW